MVPKFRCWDERVGLTEVVSIDFFRKKIKINHWEYGDSNFFPLDEVVLMQSTGMKDKKGVEIFEGDVVWIIDEGELDNGWGWSEEVIFHNGSFMAGNEKLLANVNHRCVVSGNKYERKELLEPADEN